jgi:Flp pilus assembly protein TadG
MMYGLTGTAMPSRNRKSRRALRRAAVRALMRRFGRDEDGSIILFSLFLFVMMILVGGMAVDMMRFETRRVHMQNTLDSALLSAAALDQVLDPKAVVQDYFEKAGYDPSIVDVTVQSELLGGVELVGRSVEARTTAQVGTFFMHMLQVPTLSTPIASGARENEQNVEISLVLDISGSMRWGATDNTTVADNRITRLKSAVHGFVRSVLQVECIDDGAGGETCVQPDTTSTTTINIIPYAGHVNPGPDVFELLGGSRWHNWSSCMEVTDSDFDHADLPTGSSQQLPHFMRWSVDNTWMNWGWCPKDSASILYAANDYSVIRNYIDNIKLHDGTATHVGMKYGVALLNPSSRPIFTELANRGVIDEEYRFRPANFDDNVIKYIILMTDGRTTDQWRPRVPQDGRNDNGSKRDWNYSHIYSEFMPPDGGLSDMPSVVVTGDSLSGGVPAGLSVSENLADILDRFGSVNSQLDLRPISQVEYGYPEAKTYNDGSVTHNIATNEANITSLAIKPRSP